MTRIDSVRAATGSAKDSVLHAAEVVAPYADTARDRAGRYAREARVRIGPRVSLAADQARLQYGTYVVPRIEQARSHVPPRVDEAAHAAYEAAARTRQAARQAADYSRPRIEQAVAATGPVREQAGARGAAALAALRGQISPKDVERILRRKACRARAAKAAKSLTFLGILAGAAFAAWKWWDKQANPDWLVEPPAATEIPDNPRLSSVDGSDRSSSDAEVRAQRKDGEDTGAPGKAARENDGGTTKGDKGNKGGKNDKKD